MFDFKYIEQFGVLITVLAGIYGAIKFIDYRIKNNITEPSFIQKLSNFLRPYVIFDEKESVLIDRGAMNSVDRIEVRVDATKNLPEKILVHPKFYLDHAPILTPLDNDMCTIEVCRGKGFVWIFDIKYHAYNERAQRKFSLEIIM